MSKRKKLLLFLAIGCSGILLAAAGIAVFVFFCNRHISTYGKLCYGDIELLPARDVGLLLGAAKLAPSGNENAFFKGRIEAAAKLYHAGKVRHIIISGDNSRKDYNEPQDMKEALIARGVPAAALTLDYAGFRTLDSVVRAKQIFDCSKITVISQRYHAERALYLAAVNGIDAVAFAAADPPWKWLNERNWQREKYARTAAWLDVNILRRTPKFLGKKIPLKLDSPAQIKSEVAQ